jgi:hypothetical protein
MEDALFKQFTNLIGKALTFLVLHSVVTKWVL